MSYYGAYKLHAIRLQARTHADAHVSAPGHTHVGARARRHKYIIRIAFPRQQWFSNALHCYVMRTLLVLLLLFVRVYMCAYVHIYMYMDIGLYISVCCVCVMYIYMFMCLCIYVYICTYVCVYVVCVCVWLLCINLSSKISKLVDWFS